MTRESQKWTDDLDTPLFYIGSEERPVGETVIFGTEQDGICTIYAHDVWKIDYDHAKQINEALWYDPAFPYNTARTTQEFLRRFWEIPGIVLRFIVTGIRPDGRVFYRYGYEVTE